MTARFGIKPFLGTSETIVNHKVIFS